MDSRPKAVVHTVLVVDDSRANRELVRAALEPEFRIEEAEDGTAALTITGSHPIDLILLDVMMPGLSGFDVSRKLRAARRGEYLPILFLTSLSETADRVAGFEAGADDFITKPINVHELRSRVRAFSRTRELHLERSAMLEDLERLHDLKDDLSALLVHDLRNPLAALTMQLELLELEPMSPRGRQVITDAHEVLERLRRMVDDLLQVRLLEDGARAVDLEPQPLDQVVARSARTFEPAAQSRGVELSVDTPDDITLRCDADLLQRAIENLLANALRHTPRGAHVAVRVEAGTEAVRVLVEDGGPGIPVEERPHLFSKYGGEDRWKRGRRSGHGLGLYLVGLVMRAHGGSVYLDESYAPGARVVMRFLAHRPDEEARP